MSRRKVLITAAILIAAGIITVFGIGSKKALSKKAVTGELSDENNNRLKFADFRGRVVFVNNWASWCPPCIAEMPSIDKLKKRVSGENIVFVMVSFDEDKEKASAFIKKKGFDFKVYFPGQSYPFTASSIPATYILDKSGNVVNQHIGMADYNNSEMVEQLKKLANADGGSK